VIQTIGIISVYVLSAINIGIALNARRQRRELAALKKEMRKS
jgi:hypothetical protein